jgi:hypothetical protein
MRKLIVILNMTLVRDESWNPPARAEHERMPAEAPGGATRRPLAGPKAPRAAEAAEGGRAKGQP